MVRKLILPSAFVVALGAMTSCDRADVNDGAGPVAAKVNGEAIWAYQVEGMLSQSGPLPDPGRRPAAMALERVIDQALLAQEARKAGLDRDPKVLKAFEAAQRQILSQAYLEHAVAAGGREGRAEVENFYKDHPELFQRRRIYRVLEVVAVAPQEMVNEIAKAAANADNLNEVAAWLESRKVPFNVATSSRPAEQIPLHILPRVSGMREGQIAVFSNPRGASIVQLLRSNEMPVTEQQAAPVIERYLLNRKRVDVALAEVRKLRGQAKIEYVGDYQAPRGETPAPPPARRSREAVAVLPGVSQFPGVSESIAGLK